MGTQASIDRLKRGLFLMGACYQAPRSGGTVRNLGDTNRHRAPVVEERRRLERGGCSFAYEIPGHVVVLPRCHNLCLTTTSYKNEPQIHRRVTRGLILARLQAWKRAAEDDS